jgi:hypothetical protein
VRVVVGPEVSGLWGGRRLWSTALFAFALGAAVVLAAAVQEALEGLARRATVGLRRSLGRLLARLEVL